MIMDWTGVGPAMAVIGKHGNGVAAKEETNTQTPCMHFPIFLAPVTVVST